ncbi:MAG: hypothetical protein AAGK97_13130 [Bacteroidota bacterium]
MKASLLLISCMLTFQSIAQADFIQIQTNKALCLFSFLETAKGENSTSSSFKEYIDKHLEGNEKFASIVKEYHGLNLSYSFKKEEFPEGRHSYRNTKDLIWVALSNSKNVEDFSQRIIGYLPHQTHVRLVSLLKETEAIYDELIWKEEQENILRMEKQLSNYKGQIAEAFKKVSQFYGTTWDQSIPFRISLCPIPLEKGSTSAIPKGNVLICNFLSRNENDYKGRLGVIIHEMCHILYDEQPLEMQQNLDDLYAKSNSEYAKLTYTYTDEGLATALGNGWAYEYINGALDETDWYNNKYINGFAKALYPSVKEYIDAGKSMDAAFVNQSIEIFKETFPNAIYETAILMNEIKLFANAEEMPDIEYISSSLRKFMQVRSMWFSTPIKAEQSIQTFHDPQVTKCFVIEKENAESIALLNQQFPGLQLSNTLNCLDLIPQ